MFTHRLDLVDLLKQAEKVPEAATSIS